MLKGALFRIIMFVYLKYAAVRATGGLNFPRLGTFPLWRVGAGSLTTAVSLKKLQTVDAKNAIPLKPFQNVADFSCGRILAKIINRRNPRFPLSASHIRILKNEGHSQNSTAPHFKMISKPLSPHFKMAFAGVAPATFKSRTLCRLVKVGDESAC